MSRYLRQRQSGKSTDLYITEDSRTETGYYYAINTMFFNEVTPGGALAPSVLSVRWQVLPVWMILKCVSRRDPAFGEYGTVNTGDN